MPRSSSGLDIVRKSLGKHEIATVQTTAIDKESGLVRLTTILAHSSGEWMSSEWPVCPISETASPQRMGAALTYARRYALFTLVGIAGEDDLDAPGIADGTTPSTDHGGNPTKSPLDSRFSPGRPGNGNASGVTNRTRAVLLDPEQSFALCDKVLAEIRDLASSDRATSWARAILPVKNSLTAADAKRVEEAFEQRLSELSLPATDVASDGPIDAVSARPDRAAGETPARPQDRPAAVAAEGNQPDQSTAIDKRVLAIAKPRRYRNKDHLRYVAQQPCLICGRKPSDAHHIRYAQPRALGRKASDEFTVPLCRVHHRAVHRVGNERAWWQAAGMDPLSVASKLWRTDATERGPDQFRSLAGRLQYRSDLKATRCGQHRARVTRLTGPRTMDMVQMTGVRFNPAGTAFADLGTPGTPQQAGPGLVGLLL